MSWMWSKHIQAHVVRLSQKTNSLQQSPSWEPVDSLQCSYKPTTSWARWVQFISHILFFYISPRSSILWYRTWNTSISATFFLKEFLAEMLYTGWVQNIKLCPVSGVCACKRLPEESYKSECIVTVRERLEILVLHQLYWTVSFVWNIFNVCSILGFDFSSIDLYYVDIIGSSWDHYLKFCMQTTGLPTHWMLQLSKWFALITLEIRR
jgi:hypothetical protein